MKFKPFTRALNMANALDYIRNKLQLGQKISDSELADLQQQINDAAEAKALQAAQEAVRKEEARRNDQYSFQVTLNINAHELAKMAGYETLTPENAKDLIRQAVVMWADESPLGPCVRVTSTNVSRSEDRSDFERMLHAAQGQKYAAPQSPPFMAVGGGGNLLGIGGAGQNGQNALQNNAFKNVAAQWNSMTEVTEYKQL